MQAHPYFLWCRIISCSYKLSPLRWITLPTDQENRKHPCSYGFNSCVLFQHWQVKLSRWRDQPCHLLIKVVLKAQQQYLALKIGRPKKGRFGVGYVQCSPSLWLSVPFSLSLSCRPLSTTTERTDLLLLWHHWIHGPRDCPKQKWTRQGELCGVDEGGVGSWGNHSDSANPAGKEK